MKRGKSVRADKFLCFREAVEAVGHSHAGHMVCVRCGRILEFASAKIEEEQARAARQAGFAILQHSHTLFGSCRACSKKNNGRTK